MNRFGIEYSHIALAMNNMLKDTNKNIKNMEINKTNAIAIDYSWECILSISLLILAIVLYVGTIAGLALSGPIGVVLGVLMLGLIIGSFGAVVGTAVSTLASCGWL